MGVSRRRGVELSGLGNLRVTWIFEGPSVRISHYTCVAAPEAAGEEQSQPDHVIVFPLRGSFLLRAAAGGALIDPNCVLLLNRGAPYTSSHPAGGGDEGLGVVVEEGQLLGAVRELDPGSADAASGPFRTAWVPSAPGSYLSLRSLVRALRRGATDAATVEEQVFLLLGEVLAPLAARRRGAGPTGDARAGERTQAVKAVLNARFSQKLGLQELAAVVGVSPFHLCRVFRREAGMPIHRYLNRLRLRAALEGVEGGRGDLASLAQEVGFSSHSHFTAAFRREFGLTPRELRGLGGTILTAPRPPAP